MYSESDLVEHALWDVPRTSPEKLCRFLKRDLVNVNDFFGRMSVPIVVYVTAADRGIGRVVRRIVDTGEG